MDVGKSCTKWHSLLEMFFFESIIPGWWLTYPYEKYELVSWEYDILNMWDNKIHVPNHQPE